MTQAYPPEEDKGLSMRNLTHLIYGLFALGLLSAGFFGVATIAAIVLAYLKRGDAAGTVYANHFDWVIKTFWWGLLWIRSEECRVGKECVGTGRFRGMPLH